MTKRINIAFILFLIQFCPIIADVSKDLSAESRGLKYYDDEENNGIPNVAGRNKREYEHDQLSQFPRAKAPENDGYNGPIIQTKKGNRKDGEQKFEVKQRAKKIFAIKVRKPMGFFKKSKTEQQKTKINGPKNRHIPLLNIVMNQIKLKGWRDKKFAKTEEHRQLTEKAKENKNEEKTGNENELEKIKITVDEAVEMIDQIQNIKKYTNYNKNEDKNREERSENLQEKTENSKEIHNYWPFDVEYFLGNAPKLDKKWSSDKNLDKKGSQKKTMEKSKSYFGIDLKMFKEKSFYIDKKTNIHTAVELFQHWGKHSSMQTLNNVEDIKEGKENGKNKTQHWSNKFMKVAKMIDEGCANIGPRKGKGENALCILGRLFAICLAIKEEIKDIEEFDEKFQGKIAEQLEWMRKGANDIFASFKMDSKLEINKLVKKYNKLIQIKSEMRVYYDFNDYFLDNEPLKMREIPEEIKPIMNINKIGRIIGEKSAIEVGHSFKPILRTNRDKKKTNFLPPDQKNLEQISFHENKLEQLSNFLKTQAENKMKN